jgi:endonuclease YncB( thermonuclease family)
MPRQPFKAVPLKAVRNRSRQRKRGRGFVLPLLAMSLATFTAVFFYDGVREIAAFEAPQFAAMPETRSAWTDSETARFTACSGPVRDNCVVDGDTFWYAGEKIRVADINTPEVSEPQCPREAQLGAAATSRLQALLNQGAFTLETVDRDRDAYGRLLRTVTRQGESVGAVLVREGLAEEWRGSRSGWC